MPQTDSAKRILDIAEVRMRQAGYNAVSYRDIAAEIGIKSASLHYHFPKKEDLGVALVKRYAENFSSHLKDRNDQLTQPKDKLAAFVKLYEIALIDHQLICLCAVLGAEAPGLPEPVSKAVKAFFEENIDWLTKIYAEMSVENPVEKAKSTLSILEGAMIISSVNADMSVFEAASKMILSTMDDKT